MTPTPRAVLAAALYTSTTPLTVAAGFSLGSGNWKLGVPLLVAVVVVDFFGVLSWIEATRFEFKERASASHPAMRKRFWDS